MNHSSKRYFSIIYFVLFFLFLAFYFALNDYTNKLVNEQNADFWRLLIWPLMRWMLWAVFLPLLFYMAKRYPVNSRDWLPSAFYHLTVLFGFNFLQVLEKIFYLNIIVDFFVPLNLSSILKYFINYIYFNIITYSIFLGLYYLWDYYKKFRDRELKAYRLEAQLSEARLEVLKMQLHPHFLFNTLHAISALIPNDPEAADKMVSRLSDLLRLTLEHSELQEIPLKEELEFLEIYLDIEKTRFHDRLKVIIDVDKKILDVYVPNLMLQPIVENAVRHGISPKSEGGAIEITAKKAGSKIVISVRDNGKGLKGTPENITEGFGISNTRERLKQLYGELQSFSIEDLAQGGVSVTLEIPCRKME